MQVLTSNNTSPFNIIWLRRDLRWHDNAAIALAKADGLPVLPIFIFDTDILDQLDDKLDLRLQFIQETLTKLDKELKPFHGSIATFHGTPCEVFDQIFTQYSVKRIFCSEDFEPYGRSRDAKITLLAKENNVDFVTCVDHVIHHPSVVLKSDLSPYRVYTPYSKQWLYTLNQKTDQIENYTIGNINWLQIKSKIHSLKELGFKQQPWSFPEVTIHENIINEYGAKRNLPASNANSNLGIHLRFGTISIRSLVAQAQQSKDNTFLKQLIWREFFIQIMYHYPNSMTEEFKPKYRDMPWKYSEVHFNKWTAGKTGIPLVDAGMRQLNQTGTMHNRVRMVAASWLTKNLLIDWRLGERYFASKLLDFELASNVGSWQWVAGTGCDAAPYFRIFNPFTQAKKFDPQSVYIKQWIPEIDSLSYPAPMIDYAASRAICLAFYKEHIITA